MEMPKPTEAHRKLNFLAGRWTGQEKMCPSPWEPNGGTAVCRCDNRLSVDGFLIVHDYEQQRNGAVSFCGHGVFSYDPDTKSYLLHWWDSMGVAPNVFKGDFAGNTLQMVCRGAEGNHRATWELLGDGRYHFRMEMSQDGKQWTAMMEGDYTREC